jgi:hypothetical protein
LDYWDLSNERIPGFLINGGGVPGWLTNSRPILGVGVEDSFGILYNLNYNVLKIEMTERCGPPNY